MLQRLPEKKANRRHSSQKSRRQPLKMHLPGNKQERSRRILTLP